jgi:Metallo-beta-lactamase superfamily
MQRVSELLRLSDSLSLWQAYDPAVKSDLFSTAIETSAGVFLIDPIALAQSCLEQLSAPARFAAVLVTNVNHQRAAADFARRLAVPIFAGGAVVTALAAESARSISDGGEISPGIAAIAIEGAAGGETAFHFAENGGTMVIGDALINLEAYGFALLPAKYCSDQKKMKRSLRRLLDWPFQRLLFAHGTPILRSARERLEGILS